MREWEQLVHIVKGDQPERRVLDRIGYDKLEGIATLTLLTSLQPMVRRLFLGPESSGLPRRISLIKLDKSREEPKSSAAGERKELMLKRRSLESIFGQFGFFGHAYPWE